MPARIASRDSRPSRLARYFRKTDLPPRASMAREHRLGPGIVGLGLGREEERAGLRVDLDAARVEGLVAAVPQAGMGEEVDQRPGAGERPLDALGAGDQRRRRHHRVRRVAGLARRVGGDEDRIADEVDLGRHRDVEQRPVVVAGDLVDQRQREAGLERLQREVEHRVAVHAGDLGRRVHHRGAGLVLHRLPGDHRADLAAERRDLRGVGLRRRDQRQRDLRRQAQALVVGEPGLQREVAARGEVGLDAVQRHHRGQRRRDVGDVGDDGALRRHHRVLGREESRRPRRPP